MILVLFLTAEQLLKVNSQFCQFAAFDAGGIKPLKELTPWTRYYAVAIFTLTASMLYADQNLMAPLLTPIAAEFGFNDEEKDRQDILSRKNLTPCYECINDTLP